MNTGFCAPSIPFRSIHRLIQSVLPQLSFSFYRHQSIRAGFSGGQITSDAGLLPLRAFDQRHHLTSDLAQLLSDPRHDDRVQHDALALLRQRLYQIVAGYEDANDADRLRHDPLLQIVVVADQKLGHALGSQPTLSRWENSPSARDLMRLSEHLAAVFARFFDSRSKKIGDEFRRYIFAGQLQITSENLPAVAAQFAARHNIGLPFAIDPDGRFVQQVQQDIKLGLRVGVQHTPVVFVVTTAANPSVVEVDDAEHLSQVVIEMKAKAKKGR